METIQILVRMTISFALVALLVAIASAQDAASKSDDAKPTEPSAIKNDFSVKEDDGPTESNITMPDITGTWACAEIKRANGFGGTEVPHNGETFKIRKANGTSGEFEVYDYNPMPDEDVLVLHRLKWTPKTRKFRESIVVDDGPPKEKIEHLVIVNEAGKRLAINSVFKTENGDIQNAYDSVWIRQSETVPTVPLNDLIKRMPFAPPDSENATSKSLDKNPVDSGDLDVKRNLAAKFLRTEVDFLIKQLEETSNRNQQRETFLQEMRLLDPLYVGAPVSEIVTFATSIVKRLGKQLDIEIGSKPEEIRLDWLKLIVISDSAILRDLHSAQMIEGAIDRIQEFAEQMKLIGSELKDPSIENELVSNVAYYQLGCRIGQSSGLSFQWNGETIRLIAEFLDHYPNSTGAARVAYEAGRYLEFASRKKTQIIEEDDVNSAEYWYSRAIAILPKSLYGKCAEGALRRISCKGKPIEISRMNEQEPSSLEFVLRTGKPLVVMLFPPTVASFTSHSSLLNHNPSGLATVLRERGYELVGIVCYPPTTPRQKLADFTERAKAFVTESNLNFTTIIDSLAEQQSISVRYGYLGNCDFFLVDKEGNAVRKPFNRVDDLIAYIDQNVESGASTGSKESTTDKKDDRKLGETKANIAMPDISGPWTCRIARRLDGMVSIGAAASTPRTCVLRPTNDDARKFEATDYEPVPDKDDLIIRRLSWVANTRTFQETNVFNGGPPQQIISHTARVDENGSVLWISSTLISLKEDEAEPQKEQWESIWTRQVSREDNPIASVTEYHRSNSGNRVAENKLRTSLDTLESKQIRDEIEKLDVQALALATQIRGMTKEKADDKPDDAKLTELRKSLESTLSEAFDKKGQLEQLRVQEMKSRLGRLEDQIGRRQSMRKEILERRTHELIDDVETKWDAEASVITNDVAGHQAKPDGQVASEIDVKPSSMLSKPEQAAPVEKALAAVQSQLPARQSTIGGSIQDGFQSSDETLRSYKDFAISVINARDEVAKDENEYWLVLNHNETINPNIIANVKRNMELSDRTLQYLKEEYVATLRDLKLQLDQAQSNLDAAKKTVFGLQRAGANFPQQRLEDARLKVDQAQVALKRLEIRYELYEKAGEGLPKTSTPKAPDNDPDVTKLVASLWGMQLEPLKDSDKDELKSTKYYRGGLRVVRVAEDQAAKKSGINAGDILVGLGNWETVKLDNVNWIINRSHKRAYEFGDPPTVNYFVVRNGEAVSGKLPLVPNPSRK